jgi:hypothetical protein
MVVRRTAADGTTQTELTGSDCQPRPDLAGSSQYLALGGCPYWVHVAGIGTSDPAPVECEDFDLVGTLLAGADCSTAGPELHDLATGESSKLPISERSGHTVGGIRLAGEHVALATLNFMFGASSDRGWFVTVYDRATGAERYELHLPTGPGSAPFSGMALRDDGTVVVQTADGRPYWASIAEPRLHAVPGRFRSVGSLVPLAGDVFAVAVGTTDIAVVDFDGGVVNRFTAAAEGDSVTGVAFDGSRIAWATATGAVRNEAHPYRPSPPPSSEPSPTATPQAPPSVVITRAAPRIVRGVAEHADVVRVGIVRRRRCAWVTRGGRLRRQSRSHGACTPSRTHIAAGSDSWRLRLGRRLPKGRYTVFATAAGSGGTATAKRSLLVP